VSIFGGGVEGKRIFIKIKSLALYNILDRKRNKNN